MKFISNISTQQLHLLRNTFVFTFCADRTAVLSVGMKSTNLAKYALNERVHAKSLDELITSKSDITSFICASSVF